MNDSKKMLALILASLEDMQATDVTVIDVHEQTTVTDYMIIASGRASRHVKAVAQKLIEDMKSHGLPPISSTGLEQGDWALVDLGDYIVHVMLAESRQYYNLEGLWT